MPQDKVQNFLYTADSCSFDIKGITPMKIKLLEKKPFEYILFSSEGLSKFDFKLHVHFIGNAKEPGQCRVDLHGDLNPFIFKMAEKSLGSLANTMSSKLAQLQLS